MGKPRGYVSAAGCRRQVKRAYALGLIKGGASQRDVSVRCGVSVKTVKRIIERAKKRKSLSDAPSSGRPSIITSSVKRNVKRLLLDRTVGSKRRVAAALRQEGTKIGRTTVRKVSKLVELKVRLRRYKWTLTAADRTARVAFARAHAADNAVRRRTTIYLDEKLFVCKVKSRYVWVENVTQRRFDDPGTSRE